MKTVNRFMCRLLCLLTILLMIVACEKYDPYKNPRPSSKPRPQRERHIDIPPLPSCSRNPKQPDDKGGGGGGGGCTRRSGCTRRIDTVHHEPRLMRIW